MIKHIVQLIYQGSAYYVEWDVMGKKPASEVLTYTDFETYYLEKYGEGEKEAFDKRMKRVLTKGISCFHYSNICYAISGNKAGNSWETIGVWDIIRKYMPYFTTKNTKNEKQHWKDNQTKSKLTAVSKEVHSG